MGAALVNIISQSQDDSFSISLEGYLDALYYMIITSGTVGYGDIYPITILARSVVVLILLSVFYVFADNISKIAKLMKKANFFDKYYRMNDHIVIIGTTRVKEIMKFLFPIIDVIGFNKMPRILIVGDQKIQRTDLEKLTKNALAETKIKYLSAVDGIDFRAFRKASLHTARAVYLLGHMNVKDSTNAYTQNLLHKIK